MGPSFAVRSRRIVTPWAVVDGVVVVAEGRIAGIEREAPPGVDVYDAGDYVLLPGLVDTHVHVNEPGRTDWEGYATATRAAAAGGITTIVDMPLNCIPVTTTLPAFEVKLKALATKLTVDCGFYGGLVPGNTEALRPLVARGVLGFKAFLVHSGIDDFPAVNGEDLERAMPLIAASGVPLLVHAELEAPLPSVAPVQGNAVRSYARYLASRPRSWEENAVAMMIAKSRATQCRVHVVHLSAASALPMIAEARALQAPVSVETCPHYLTFAAEDVADGDTRFKCAPPIRERDNADGLWAGLKGGVIDSVVSDHSPCAPHLKLAERGDFEAAWGGIAGLQVGLAATWTQARKRGFSVGDLARWMAERPAVLMGLGSRKGKIAPGFDADLVAFNPDRHYEVQGRKLEHRHKVTPYDGLGLWGTVEATFLRGQLIYERGQFKGACVGRPVGRDAAPLSS